jgi:hypothetical protein
MNDPDFVRCDFCLGEIPHRDFREGRAVRVAGRNYCTRCMATAIEKGKSAEHPPDLRTPRPEAPATGAERRRHPRRETILFLEVAVYSPAGRLLDRGSAVMRNVSLSGALLGGVVVPAGSAPGVGFRIGIRLLEGPLQMTEILCRVVRSRQRGEGLEVALEFEGTETAKVEELRKIV